MRIFWLTLGGLSLSVGVVGIVVPLLPTTLFVIIAAFCFARSSQRLHDWLIGHRYFGPMIRDWRTEGAIRRPAKIMATVSIGVVFALSLLLDVASGVLLLQAAVLLVVLLFIWTRPEGTFS